MLVARSCAPTLAFRGPRGRVFTLLQQLRGIQITPRRCAAQTEELTIDPIPDCTFGAVVRGVSILNDDLDDPKTFRRVEQALRERALLVFSGQTGLSEEQ